MLNAEVYEINIHILLNGDDQLYVLHKQDVQ